MTLRILLLISIAVSLSAQVSFDRLLNAAKEPQNWLTYSGSMMSRQILFGICAGFGVAIFQRPAEGNADA